MEKVKKAIIGVLRAMQKRSNAQLAAEIEELISVIASFEPKSAAA